MKREGESVGRRLADNPTAPLAAAVLVGTGLAIATTARGAGALSAIWQKTKSRFPDIKFPSFGGGGGDPATTPPVALPTTLPAPPPPQVPSPTTVIVQPAYPTPSPSPSPSPFVSASSGDGGFFADFRRGLDRIRDAAREGEVINIPGTRIPIPTSPQATIAFGRGVGATVQRVPEGFIRAGGGLLGSGVGFVRQLGIGDAPTRDVRRRDADLLRRGTNTAVGWVDYALQPAPTIAKDLFSDTYRRYRQAFQGRPAPIPVQRGRSTRSSPSGRVSFGGSYTDAAGNRVSPGDGRARFGTSVPIRRSSTVRRR